MQEHEQPATGPLILTLTPPTRILKSPSPEAETDTRGVPEGFFLMFPHCFNNIVKKKTKKYQFRIWN